MQRIETRKLSLRELYELADNAESLKSASALVSPGRGQYEVGAATAAKEMRDLKRRLGEKLAEERR